MVDASSKRQVPTHVMTIAGSDSSGGAGIQADLKTIEAWGCYGSSVLTGLTAQNTLGVQGVHTVPAAFVTQQLQSVWDDAPPRAVKLGMLTSAETVHAVHAFLAQTEETGRQGKRAPTVVLDPVMVSSSGHSLVDQDATDAIRSTLLGSADWITPNLPEANVLAQTDVEVKSISDMLALARKLSRQCPQSHVLLKGGHLPLSKKDVLAFSKEGTELVWLDEDEDGACIDVLELYGEAAGRPPADQLVVDVLHDAAASPAGGDGPANGSEGGRVTLYVSRMVDTTSTHGTGCTLSSAIACAVAQSPDAPPSVVCRRAVEYVKSAIASAFPFGSGNGPLHHAHLSYRRALPPPTPSNPHPFTSHLIRSNLPLWKSYVRHPFVVQLGKGTLPVECFAHYIKQDYLYLQHYARAHALGAYKASTFADIKAFTDIAAHITRESALHVKFCESFGVTIDDLTDLPESAACAAYARYIIDVGTQGDMLDLYVAVASCLIGYGEVGLWLQKQVQCGGAIMEGNRYARWMEDYAGKDFLDAVNRGIENLERRVAQDPPSPERLARLTKIWHECVRLERDFWQMGMDKS